VARCSSSRASSTYKGRRKPEFQKIRRIKAALFIISSEVPLGGSEIFWILVWLSMFVPPDARVSLVFSFLLLLAAHNWKTQLVERDNLPRALLAAFAPLGGKRGVVFGSGCG
jgi:hypothetical protein